MPCRARHRLKRTHSVGHFRSSSRARCGSKIVRSPSHSTRRLAMQKSAFRQSLLVKHFAALEANNGAPRPQFLYRQLGVEEATGGAYDAHVIKGVPGSKPPIAEHKHTELDFLFVYVLKGWMSFHYHDHGEHRLKAGDCHIIPPGLAHTVTGWSEDVEILEITAPGHYRTVDTVNGLDVAPATA